jgi:altronate hydrolase
MDNKKVIALKIHEGDNVAVVLEDVKRGQMVQCGDREIIANSGIGRGHKIALTDIDMG